MTHSPTSATEGIMNRYIAVPYPHSTHWMVISAGRYTSYNGLPMNWAIFATEAEAKTWIANNS